RFGRNRSNVWHYPGANSFSRCGEEGNLLALHPTVKPVAMVADAILDCSARGEIVLDAFLGSGTTVIAAERTGRRCYGLELDPAIVTEHGGRSKVSKRQAIVTQLVNRSATADFRAIKILLDIVRDIERQTEATAPETSDFSEADEKVLEQIRARFSIGKPEQ